jgi:hypothetical protein
MTEPCPICSEFRYISLVSVCPLCGAQGKKNEVKSTAEEYLRRLEAQRIWDAGTFQQIWDSIPDLPYGTQTQRSPKHN